MNNTLAGLYNKISKTIGKPPSTLRVEGIVSNIQILNDGMVEMTVLVEDYPECDAICQTEELFEKTLDVPEVRFCLHATDPAAMDIRQYLPWAFRHIEKKDFFLCVFLKTAVIEKESDETVTISLQEGCEEVMEKGADRMLAEFFQKTLRKSISFSQKACSFTGENVVQNSFKEAADMANKSRGKMDLTSRGNNTADSKGSPKATEKKDQKDQKEQKSKDTPDGPAKLGANPRTPAIPNKTYDQQKKMKEYKKVKQPAGVIWGKINPDLSLVPMNTLNNETGQTMIEGAVFGVESRPVSNGTKVLMKFCLTDKTNSVRCFAFMQPDEALDFEEQYKKAYLRICAEVGFDSQYEKDLVARVIGIQIATPPKKKADASIEKRVELHCHSKMSSKDSVCEVSDIINLAVHYGHEAVAITDHGVVQAFPDARVAQLDARKKGKAIKIIYGIECYLVEDGPCLAYLCDEHSLDNGFVAIHIETSGKDPATDRIQKIEAISFEPDEQGRYIPVQEFLRTFPPDADTASSLDLLADFERFLDGRPVVAHKVLPQLAFLRYEGFRTNKEQDPRVKFFQPAIDTFQTARVFYPDLEDCSEEKLQRYLDLEQNPTGRSFSKAFIAGRFMDFILAVKQIKTVPQLNEKAGNVLSRAVLSDAKNQYHCILLATDAVGLYGLYRLVSESHLHFIYKERPRITRSLLEFYRSGLVFGSACEAGELFISIMELYDQCHMDYEKTREALASSKIPKIAEFYDYLEIQPVGNNQFMLRTTERKGQVVPAKYQSMEDLRNLDRLVVDLGELLGKPVCATCDVHFLQPSDSIYREIMQSDMGFSDANLQAPLYFRTTDEMLKEFEFLGEGTAKEVVIQNPKAIAARITPDMKPFPEGSFPPVIATAAHDIEELTWATAKSLYEKDGLLPEIVKSRIKKELKSIIGNGFAIMYYIAHKLVKKSNDDGYIVGSRGSVGSSFVATLCGITEVNPLEPHYYCPVCHYSEFNSTGEYGSGYDMPKKQCPECGEWLVREGQDIPFETFLGFEGEKQPDIDLNFSGEYQPVAHKFIEEMFGASHTFRAGTISGYAEKNAISMVLKYCSAKDTPVTKAESLRLATGLIGVKRTTGQHPGGIVVVPKERDIYDFTPVQCPADKTENGIITTHFDFNSLHDTILKLDILGHDDPTMLKVLGDMTGVDVRTIPVPDDEVMKLFLSGEPLKFEKPGNTDSGTLGLPELGTFMARGMIKDTKPTRFYDLVQLMGLSHGTDVWKGNAQDLIRSGTCSVSEVIGCRDSIMTSLMHWGLPPKSAFVIMEKVRKGKGLTEEQENLMKEHHVPEWYIESCKKIKYMFPKAHAAAYSISSLRIAWFKVYHVAEYYCAFFTIRADEFDSRLMCRGMETVRHYREKLYPSFREKEKITLKILGKEEDVSIDKAQKTYYILELIEEMYCRGVEFLPVDIYESEATRFKKVSEKRIRPPLNTLPSLSETVARNIVDARAGVDKFLSREEFARKAGIGDSLLALLAAQGCLEDMPETTQIDLFSLLA